MINVSSSMTCASRVSAMRHFGRSAVAPLPASYQGSTVPAFRDRFDVAPLTTAQLGINAVATGDSRIRSWSPPA
jgi:hypothetical protein